ncbi:MAG: ankyrin repeat domain-containing protein [Pirellulales bacterium]
MAARDGDLRHLTAAIELEKSGIERLHQGYTALHLAILYGHVSAVQLLLAAGANPNSVAADGMTSLQACALSNSLDDEESCFVAQALLNASGNSIRNTPQSDLAQSYANSRGKKMLAAIL